MVAQREKTPGEQVMIGLIWTSDWLRKWPAICQLVTESTEQAEKQSNCEITIDTKLKIAVLRDMPTLRYCLPCDWIYPHGQGEIFQIV